MGVVIRQSLINSLSSYAGLALGTLNTLVLYPLAFMPDNTDYYGLIQILLNYTLIVSMFTAVGMPQVIIKFYKRLEEGVRGNLTFFGVVIPIFVIIPISLLIWYFKEPLAAWLTQNPNDEALVGTYLPLLSITVLFNVYFEIFSSVSQAHLKSILPMFLKEIGRRSMITILILLVLLDLIDFNTFVWLFTLLYPTQLLVLTIVLYRKKQLQFTTNFKGLPLKELLDFGLFSFLAFGGDLLLNRIDQFMITKYIDLENLAYYTIAFFIGNVINTPNRASTGITKPLVVNHLEKDDFTGLDKLYKLSSLGLMIASGVLFIAIVPNLIQLYQLLPLQFKGGVLVTIIIATSKLISTSNGINGMILSMSAYYRLTFWTNIALIVCTVVTNLLLIPEYGIQGAAFATMIVIVANNIWKTLFLYFKYKIWPFGRSFLIVFPWMVLVAFSFFKWTQIDISPWIGIPLRAGLGALVFLVPIYLTNLFPQMNGFIKGSLVRIKGKG